MRIATRQRADDNHRGWQAIHCALKHALHSIAASPTPFPFLESLRRNKRFRRVILKGFPVFLVYEIVDDEVLIVAVAHGARRAGYWRGRLGTRRYMRRRAA
jgi:hypothetical protein